MVAISEETKTQVELLRAIYETRTAPMHTVMNYYVSAAVGFAAVWLTYDLSLKTNNWVSDAFFGGIVVGFIILYTERMLLERNLSIRLAEYLRYVAMQGTIFGDFQIAVKEMSVSYVWQFPYLQHTPKEVA